MTQKILFLLIGLLTKCHSTTTDEELINHYEQNKDSIQALQALCDTLMQQIPSSKIQISYRKSLNHYAIETNSHDESKTINFYFNEVFEPIYKQNSYTKEENTKFQKLASNQTFIRILGSYRAMKIHVIHMEARMNGVFFVTGSPAHSSPPGTYRGIFIPFSEDFDHERVGKKIDNNVYLKDYNIHY